MEDKVQNLLSYFPEIDFGDVNLSGREKEFYRELNNEIISLCKSLPESTQKDALIFFMRYSRISFGPEPNFFRNYYAPTWSIIYWLIQSCPSDKGLEQKDIKNAITAHAMAMSLHSLDDHLSDGEMTVTHLALLLRSQLWMIMNNALNSLADGVDGGKQIIQGFINDYYSSIRTSKGIQSLDSYCDLFRKQMATGLIVPALMIKKMNTDEEFRRDIQTAYRSFGIAWRLLDDIKDIETDMMKCIHSSIYTCLPEEIKNHWDKDTEDKNRGCVKVISNYILESSMIDRIKERICSELELAASIADDYGITGLADEFRNLLSPLKNGQGRL